MSDGSEPAGLAFPKVELQRQTGGAAVGVPDYENAVPKIVLTYSDAGRLLSADETDPLERTEKRLVAVSEHQDWQLERVERSARFGGFTTELYVRFADRAAASRFCCAVDAGVIDLDADADDFDATLASLADVDCDTSACPECNSVDAVGELPSGEFMCRDCVEVFSDE